MSNILKEMKENSGVALNEMEVSQVKMMNAESRLIGAFGNLLRELMWIQRDSEGPHNYSGCGSMSDMEREERDKGIDKETLYKIAKEKLEIVEKEIAKTFKVEIKEKKVSDGDED